MESVTKIENSAFWGCVNLKTIRGYAVSYVESYAKEYGYIFEDVEGKITTSYRTHVQSFGWQNPVTNGAMSGTSGEALKEQGFLNMNACIAYAPNEDEYLTNNSVEFHAHLGYRMVGQFYQCGYKFGRWYDMVWMEKLIGEHGANPKRPF